MTSSIPIIVDNKVNPAFVNANKFILDKNQNTRSFKDLKLAWKSEFNCDLTDDFTLIFEDNKKLSMFVLRWG